VRMDCQCLEVWLGLPACRVIHQVRSPQQREWPLERRDSPSVCPHCGTCCSRGQESRPRCIRDRPILERPVMLWLHRRRLACPECRPRPWDTRATVAERTKWTPRLSQQGRAECLRGCPCNDRARRSGLSARTGLRGTFARSRGGRPRPLGRALGIEA
jgi:transposase